MEVRRSKSISCYRAPLIGGGHGALVSFVDRRLRGLYLYSILSTYASRLTVVFNECREHWVSQFRQ